MRETHVRCVRLGRSVCGRLVLVAYIRRDIHRLKNKNWLAS